MNLIVENLFSKIEYKDPYAFLIYHGKKDVADHSEKVSVEAKRLARVYSQDELEAETAGAYHDISCVIDNNDFIEVASAFGICVNSEENKVPLLLHQKISREIANKYFGIDNSEVLNAIACHTTLSSKASKLDLILFVADKLTWEYKENKVLIDNIRVGLETSLENGAYIYLKDVWDRKHEISALHPNAEEAYFYLKKLLEKQNGDGIHISLCESPHIV